MDKSEGQLLEDAKADGPMLTSVPISPKGSAVLVSPNDDDPLVYLKAVDQLRHERSLRPSHVDEGGGDVSQVDYNEHFEFERPYFGPSHVDEGGGAELKKDNLVSNQWRSQSRTPHTELPTEVRKLELKNRIADAEQFLLSDPCFFCSAWCIRHSTQGPQREKVLEQFWRKVYQEHVHDDRRIFKEFALNDLLEASDELYRWENPMSPVTSSWGFPWKRRSSADTVGSSSLRSSIVGTESVHAMRSHPEYTMGFSN
jgi:hypothetical protein